MTAPDVQAAKERAERDAFLQTVIEELVPENTRWPGLWTRLESLMAERDALAARVEQLETALREIAEDRVPTTYGGGLHAVRGRARAALAGSAAGGQEDCPHCAAGVPRFNTSEGMEFETWAHRYGGEPGTIMPCAAGGQEERQA